MNSLTLTAPSSFTFGETPTPQAGAGEVLVKVAACGICGSDVHGMDGSSGRRIPPVIMGHEAAGVIAEVGEGVAEWSVGDRVTFDSMLFCGDCAECKEGKTNLCPDRRVIGVSCEDYRQEGAFAEYVSIPARLLLAVPDGVAHEEACFSEPVAVALHAVGRLPADEVKGGTAVVVGAGLIGLFVVQALKIAGCREVIAVDLDDSRLALAEELGASRMARGDQPDAVIATVAEATGGRMADVALEVVGATPTVQLAERCLKTGGSLCLVGNLAAMVEFPLQRVVTREISVFGTAGSSGEFADALAAIADGSIQVRPLLSETVPLAEGGEWFAKLATPGSDLLKVVLQP